MTLVMRCNSIHRYIIYEALWTIDKMISVMSMDRHCLPSNIWNRYLLSLPSAPLPPTDTHSTPGMQVPDPQAFQCLISTDRLLCCYLSAGRYFIQVSTYIKRKTDLIVLAVSQTRVLWFNDFQVLLLKFWKFDLGYDWEYWQALIEWPGLRVITSLTSHRFFIFIDALKLFNILFLKPIDLIW